MKKNKILIILSIIIITTIKLNAQTSLSGTTFSYTDKHSGISSYFTFTSPTDVAWYFGSPSRFIFPVGYGKYNTQCGTIIFSKEKNAHKKISLYYRGTDIIFEFRAYGNQATMRCYDEDIFNCYNNGGDFTAIKELYNLTPDSYLVGTSWICDYNDKKLFLYFKSNTEALIDGESHLYFCMKNFVSIKSGDNLTDENLVGTFNSNIMYVYRDGLAGAHNDDNNLNFRFKRIE